MRQMAVPTTFSRTGAKPERLAPQLGADGPAVLAEAGLDPKEIAALVDAGVLTLPKEA